MSRSYLKRFIQRKVLGKKQKKKGDKNHKEYIHNSIDLYIFFVALV